MFEAEHRTDVISKQTGKWQKSIWKPTREGDPNHAFDTFVYNLAALELIADRTCREILGLKVLSWSDFWEYCKKDVFFKYIT